MEHKIIQEFVDNYRLVSASDFEEIAGPQIYDVSTIAACAAVITILNHLKEEN